MTIEINDSNRIPYPVNWCQRQISGLVQPLNQGFCKNLLTLIKRIGLCITAILFIIPAAIISGAMHLCNLSSRRITPITEEPASSNTNPPAGTHVPISEANPFQPQRDSIVEEDREVLSNQNYHLRVTDWSDLGEQQIPFNEDLLCQYLSDIPRNLQGKKFLVLSLDLGGFGDFVFGLKSLDLIQRQFPGARVALATDSPARAALVNTARNHQILQPQNVRDKMPLEEIVPVMEEFRPDFLIVAPVTHFNRAPLSRLLDQTPHMFIREYGFTSRFAPMEGNEYISGAGRDFKGMMIHTDLVKWANSEDSKDVLKRLSNLQFLHDSRIVKALLDSSYSEESVANFAQRYELFLGYSQRPESKREFIVSVAKMTYQYAKTEKNLCFFFMGQADHRLLTELEICTRELTDLQIGEIQFIDPLQGSKKVVLNVNNPRVLRIVQAPLSSSEVISMLKASEKETLSTGDQFWSETISANKHWIQENLCHKREALKSVIGLAQTIPSYLRGKQDFYHLLARAHHTVAIFQKNPLERCEAQAQLLYQARITPTIAADWRAMNNLVTSENILETWMTGMIIKKFLELNPRIKREIDQTLQSKTVSASSVVALLTQCYDAAQG